MALKKWKKLSEKLLFQNPYWNYKLDQFEIDENVKGEYHYVNSPGSTLIIPVNSNNKLLLVKQYRYLIDQNSIEFPCGAISNNVLPVENAQKELREETGYSAKTLEKVGAFVPYNGVSNEFCYVYIGYNLEYAPLKRDKTEEIELVEMSIKELEQGINSNDINDGMTIAAYTMSKSKIYKSLG